MTVKVEVTEGGVTEKGEVTMMEKMMWVWLVGVTEGEVTEG